MTDQFDSAANDLLQYPKSFHEFLAVVDLFGRAREIVQKPGEGFNEALLRTTSEIDAALAIFREVWANADAGRAAPSTPENAGGVQGTKASSYKLLDHGDVIQCGDEVLADDTVNWLPLVGWEVGMKWGCNFMPMRRPAGVAVPQAPTVRQSSNQRDEKE